MSFVVSPEKPQSAPPNDPSGPGLSYEVAPENLRSRKPWYRRTELVLSTTALVMLVTSAVVALDHLAHGSRAMYSHVLLFGGILALVGAAYFGAPVRDEETNAEPMGWGLSLLAGLLGAVFPVMTGFVLYANAPNRHGAILSLVAYVVIAAVFLYAVTVSSGRDRRRWLWFWLGIPAIALVADGLGLLVALALPGPLHPTIGGGHHGYQSGPMVVVGLFSFIAVTLGTHLVLGRRTA